jgi:hypothetical protein
MSTPYSEILSKSVPTYLLSETNWFSWTAFFTPYLRAKGLLETIEGKETTVDGAKVIVNEKYEKLKLEAKDESNDATKKKALNDYEREASSVTLLLRGSAVPNIASEAEDCEWPWQIWSIYEKICKPEQNSHWQKLTESEIESQSLKAGEPVASLIRRIKSLAKIYETVHKQPLSDERKCRILYSAIEKSKVREWMMWKMINENNQNTFEVVQKKAKDFELEKWGTIQDGMIQRTAPTSSSSSSSSSNIRGGITLVAAAPPQRPPPTSHREKICFKCNEKGHINRFCPLLKAERTEVANTATSNPKRICNYCKKIGHTEEVCRKKKRDIKKNGKEEKEYDDPFAALLGLVFATENPFAALAKSSTNQSTINWFLDSAASRHVVTDRRVLQTIRRLKEPIAVTIADGKKIIAEYEGDTVIRTDYRLIKLNNVLLYESDLFSVGLISIGTLDRKGVEVSIGGGVLTARFNGSIILCGELKKE